MSVLLAACDTCHWRVKLECTYFVEYFLETSCLIRVGYIDMQIDCSLAWPACLVLIESLRCQPPLCSGHTIRCKISILSYCLLHNFKLKLWSSKRPKLMHGQFESILFLFYFLRIQLCLKIIKSNHRVIRKNKVYTYGPPVLAPGYRTTVWAGKIVY